MTVQNPQALIGQWLPGGYRIRRLIGAGAFAWVYHATTARNESVAIKVLQSASPEARTMFVREIKILRQLPLSANCVRYIDDGVTDDGLLFLAMEYVDGCTLKDGFKFKPVWDVDEACELMLQLCDALGGLHRLGLAHRDLKPENIMLTRDWQVKLMDFGLVKDAQGLLKLFESEDILTGRDFAENIDKAMLAGTPEYMAPEQFSDPLVEDESQARTDTWTDVYSLGLIFYQLLTGRKLFPFQPSATDQSGYARALLAYIKSRTNFSDRDLVRPEEIPPALWPVIAAALRQDPKRRPHDAAALAVLIRQYVETGESAGAFEDDSQTSIADMSKLLAGLQMDSSEWASWETTRTRPRSSASSKEVRSNSEEDNERTATPFDVATVQAYREERLNAPGGPNYTLPPGALFANQVLAAVPIPPQPVAPAAVKGLPVASSPQVPVVRSPTEVSSAGAGMCMSRRGRARMTVIAVAMGLLAIAGMAVFAWVR